MEKFEKQCFRPTLKNSVSLTAKRSKDFCGASLTLQKKGEHDPIVDSVLLDFAQQNPFWGGRIERSR